MSGLGWNMEFDNFGDPNGFVEAWKWHWNWEEKKAQRLSSHPTMDERETNEREHAEKEKRKN